MTSINLILIIWEGRKLSTLTWREYTNNGSRFWVESEAEEGDEEAEEHHNGGVNHEFPPSERVGNARHQAGDEKTDGNEDNQAFFHLVRVDIAEYPASVV